MQSQAPDHKKVKELSLSGSKLVALIRAVHERGAQFRFRANGFSMAPFIKNGDILTIAQKNGRKARFGEVVAFENPHTSKLCVHRIVGRRGNKYLIKGDNIPAADGTIHEDRLIGKVTRVERGGKTIWFGLGAERMLIAVFSRLRILSLLSFAEKMIRFRSKSTA